MKNRSRAGVALIAGVCLSLGTGSSQTHSQVPSAVHRGAVMTMHASGTFEVKLTPQGTDDKADGTSLGRMSINKQFHGGLEATSKGEMLTAGTSVKGSAGYVAIERVSGYLNGRTGTFILQHNATMDRGAPHLNIIVVP